MDEGRGGGSRRRGGRRGRGGRGRGRSKSLDPQKQAQLKLREAVVALSPAREAVEALVQQALADDVREWPSVVLDAVVDAAQEIPAKTSVYAFLLSLLNAHDPSFGSSAAETLHARLLRLLHSHSSSSFRAHNLARALGLLSPACVLHPESILSSYTALVDSALSLSSSADEHWQLRADNLVHCVLSALPFVSRSLQPAAPELFEHMLTHVREYLTLGHRVSPPVGLENEDTVKSLWNALEPLLSNPTWVVPGTEHLMDGNRTDDTITGNLHFLSEPSKRVSFEFCQDIPSRLLARAFVHQRPQVHATDVVPDEHYSIERHIAETLIDTTLWAYEEQAASSDGIHHAGKELATTVTSCTSFDSRQLISERIFSEMLALPYPRFRPTYYTTVANNICTADKSFARYIGSVVGSLFRSIDSMEFNSRILLSNFLAHHLSVFKIGWPWHRWEHVAEQIDGSPQREYVRSVLDKLVRLTFHDRVKEALPDALHELLPPRVGFVFPYEAEQKDQNGMSEIGLGSSSSSAAGVSKEIIRRIREDKQPAEDMLEWLQGTVLEQLDGETTFDALAYSLLQVGSKSPTHLITALERYGSALQALVPSTDPMRMLDAAADYWQNSVQHLCLTLDRLQQHGLASGMGLLEWAFNRDELGSESTCVGRALRELVEHVMFMAVSRADGAAEMLSKARARYEKAESAVQQVTQNGESETPQAPGHDEQQIMAERERYEAEVGRRKEEHDEAIRSCNDIIAFALKKLVRRAELVNSSDRENAEIELLLLRSAVRRYKPFVSASELPDVEA